MAGEHAGQTIIEMLWDQAVAQYGALREAYAQDPEARGTFVQQGKVAGLAYAIAKLLNPYAPDLAEVKQLIKDRYDADQEEDEE